MMFMGLTDTEVCNYADGTTLYACNISLEDVVDSLYRDTQKVTTWFAGNYMKLNEEECHLMIFSPPTTDASIHVGKRSNPMWVLFVRKPIRQSMHHLGFQNLQV